MIFLAFKTGNNTLDHVDLTLLISSFWC